MRKKNICFVNPTVILKRPIVELAVKLKERGHTVGILCPRKAFKELDSTSHYSKRLKGIDVYTYPTIDLIPGSSEWPFPVSPVFWKRIRDVGKKYDVFHVWTYFYATSVIPLWTVKQLFKKKTIITCDTFPGYSFQMPGSAINKAMRLYGKIFGRRVFGLADLVTVYTKTLLDYVGQLGIPKGKASVVSTGINLKKIRETVGKDIRKEFGIEEKTKVLLFVGMMIPRKGIDTIIKTVDALRGSDIKVLLVGDGPNRAEYEKMVEDIGLGDKIIFTGWRSDVIDFYKGADIFFFPSKGEGLPGVVMEAMACSLPVVASDVVGNRDLIEDGKTGYLCGVESTREYAEKIKKLLQNDKMAKEFESNASQSIKSLEWCRVLKDYEALYERLR